MIISLRSEKGGVRKSALARLSAVEYAKSGWSVKIGDLGKNQGSTTKWKLRRDANSINLKSPWKNTQQLSEQSVMPRNLT